VLVLPPEDELDLTLDEVAGFTMSTGLVYLQEISVGRMARGNHIIILPVGLALEVLVRAIPQRVWDIGVRFKTWSLLDRATVAVPRFKVWVSIVDMPPELWNVTEAKNVAALFGTYLGTINLAYEGCIISWNMVVAVTDLVLIPDNATINIVGMDIWMCIVVIKWVHYKLYAAEDFLKPAISYNSKDQVAMTYPSCSSSEDSSSDEDPEKCWMPRQVLLEVVGDCDPSMLLEEIRGFLLMPKGGDTRSRG
jgi:hypothetical protein